MFKLVSSSNIQSHLCYKAQHYQSHVNFQLYYKSPFPLALTNVTRVDQYCDLFLNISTPSMVDLTFRHYNIENGHNGNKSYGHQPVLIDKALLSPSWLDMNRAEVLKSSPSKNNLMLTFLFI